ncbi:hypothetical protein D3093_33560 (plasmid) [Azospirillum argentinense]|uniref:PNPLA domain-containing protein n=1 Tax=Azospirillum argentinense TaxID=2970906 RepID=A0A4D8PS91_9PROT|nr:hypothetical protein D3093_33560 [Azospirillum argentinense]
MSSDRLSRLPPKAVRAFVAFEGGGAKGLVHVGALKAMEARGIEICGSAGTSAGALVAGLVAAGYRADELFNPDTGQSIVTTLCFDDATDLLGRDGWSAINRCRKWSTVIRSRKAWLFLAAVTLIINLGVFWLLDHIGLLAKAMVATGEIVVVGAIVWWLVIKAHRGLATLDHFIRAYDLALRLKLGLPPGRRITFFDLQERGGCSLKVISANLATRRMVVYGTGLTPNVSVAEAVAASACIPGVFVPVTVEGSIPADAPHYDGGLVSNLPAWVFDEERVIDPGAVTIALEIADTPTNAVRPSKTSEWLAALVRTAVFGGSALNTRGMDRLHTFRLTTDVDVLDFDVSMDAAKGVVRDGAAYAEASVALELFDTRELFESACETVRDRVLNGIQRLSVEAGGEGVPDQVRVMLIVPAGPSSRLARLAYGTDLRDGSEEDLILPMEGSLAGAAFKERQAIFDAKPFTPSYDLQGTANAHRRARVWSHVTWRVAIPIFTKQVDVEHCPDMVLAIDGDGDKNYAIAVVDEAFMVAAAELITTAANVVAARRAELEGGQ